jgi:hypothetical protein
MPGGFGGPLGPSEMDCVGPGNCTGKQTCTNGACGACACSNAVAPTWTVMAAANAWHMAGAPDGSV